MLLSDFDFHFSKELIATHPVHPKDSALLLCVLHDELLDGVVPNFLDYLSPGDVIVFNNSKVLPMNLQGLCNGKKINVNLHKSLSSLHWLAFIRPAKKVAIGDVIEFADDFKATVISKNEGEVGLTFLNSPTAMILLLEKYGKVPLPPYMRRGIEDCDIVDYQTIYAKHPGSAAAPTAGLHFTAELFQHIQERDVKIAFVTLHVGAGTFLPVKTEEIENHQMHSEFFSLTAENAAIINQAKQRGAKLMAVGTTSVRVLETIASEDGVMRECSGETSIFIYPGYKFKMIDILMTNFHLPKSTLFMLVCAFAGADRMKNAYQHAINNNYRFFSYGDACLLFKE